ncbi:DUF1203 domain-containing protein [Jatrophihabitans sp. YIM 134969]
MTTTPPTTPQTSTSAPSTRPTGIPHARRAPTGTANDLLIFSATGHGEPLRRCLRYARPGEDTALISYATLDHPSVWTEVGPVFVHGGRCAGPVDQSCSHPNSTGVHASCARDRGHASSIGFIEPDRHQDRHHTLTSGVADGERSDRVVQSEDELIAGFECQPEEVAVYTDHHRLGVVARAAPVRHRT